MPTHARLSLLAVLAGVAGAQPPALTPSFHLVDGETVIAMAVATSPPWSADGSGRTDAGAAIQRAIDDVVAAGGGVVFLPAGRYRLEHPLKLGWNTLLRGEWTAPERGGLGQGTILLAYPGRGREDDPALLTVPPHRETGLVGLTIWYPEQDPAAPVPYPATIAGGSARLERLTLVNAWRGIRLEIVNASCVAEVYGTVLRHGLAALRSLEFSWFHDIRFANRYWREFATAIGRPLTAEQSAALDAFTRRNLIGLELGRLDGLAIDGLTASDALLPVLIQKNAEQETHPVFGFGGVVRDFPARRREVGWDPWYYRMHYANLDNVPEAAGARYEFAAPPSPARTGPDSFYLVTDAPFGAVGDGQVDDTDAIESALQTAGRAGGGTVCLPLGQWRLTRPLVVPTGVELRGPLGAAPIRQFKEACSLLADFGHGTAQPETAPACLTLAAGAGVRGLTIVHPGQATEAAALAAYPFTIRGRGAGVWVVDVHLLDSWLGIDLASYRCDEHLVQNVWGTVFREGVRVGGGSAGGRLERVTFSYGPWTEAGRTAAARTDAGKQAMAEYTRRHTIFYTFGDCERERTWGLCGFYPRIHVRFAGCRDSDFDLSLHDVADEACVLAEQGSNLRLRGYFGTGGRDGTHNWLEVADGFTGPLEVHAATIEPRFWNHPLTWRPEQVQLLPERSLTAGRPATASGGSTPGAAVDRDVRTLWTAPAGSWLQVDLGAPTRIDRFGIESAGLLLDPALNTKVAELRVSLDGVQWSTAATLHTNGASWGSQPCDAVAARYVRLQITDPGAEPTIRVVSFDVYAAADVAQE